MECQHKIINHSEGFKNADGNHTKFAENLWSRLKSEINKKHGVKRENIENFLL
jgi:hypothetical protein